MLAGVVHGSAMLQSTPGLTLFDPSCFEPSLQEAIGGVAMNLNRVWCLAMRVTDVDGDSYDDMEDRRDICFTDGQNWITWRAGPLAELFRGDAKPPNLAMFPKEFVPLFATIEEQVTVYADVFVDPTDDEMRDIYNHLRRLPDGKGRSLLHEHMWQACALALATRPWSRAEFEAVVNRLERSCRTFRTHPGSRNYLETLRKVPG